MPFWSWLRSCQQSVAFVWDRPITSLFPILLYTFQWDTFFFLLFVLTLTSYDLVSKTKVNQVPFSKLTYNIILDLIKIRNQLKHYITHAALILVVTGPCWTSWSTSCQVCSVKYMIYSCHLELFLILILRYLVPKCSNFFSGFFFFYVLFQLAY